MKKLILASRPKTLIASISPICIGTVMAYSEGSFQFWVFLFTLLTGLGIQISTNFANDLFDYLKGADTAARKGPTRVTASGLMSVIQVKLATFVIMLATALFGSALIFRGGLLVACLLALALLLALAYTAGPFPLAYLGIAEFFVLIFFGPVATGCTYFLQTMSFDYRAFIAGAAPGLISCGLLIVNNLRDIDEDREAGKKTLVSRLGTAFGKWEFASAIFIACLIPFFFYEKHLLVLLCSLCLIPAAFLIRFVLTNTDPYAYNLALEKTGKLLFLYTAAFSIGYFL